ncbi:hypothetical protein BO85DRAFT_489669 [Aspergillus piperis CBS 112811]|uniref:Uncharacterized protein n=1 Tax=Aspergillus piperis CBS 112811 TaxID=1448313 RepID=A0A8G1QYJ9_9EURO|nr:hypothetical protein BO85DRAFT_489669 [Aspergillus piperis CBS 112811]RAH56278.1 hypothetical protein BO85DRAFT_489669 [Aspergillus piperis CBS 112811]
MFSDQVGQTPISPFLREYGVKLAEQGSYQEAGRSVYYSVACEVQDLFVTCRSSALSGALHAVQSAEARKRRFSTANKTPSLLI